MNVKKNLDMILAAKKLTVFDNQGDYSGDCIEDLMLFDNEEDFNLFIAEIPKYDKRRWYIIPAFKKPRFSEGRPGGLLG